MFRFCKTRDELKQLYRELSKFLHPDKNGDHDLFIRLTHAYEYSLDELEGNKPKKENKSHDMKYNNIIYDVESEEFDIIIEIFAYAKRNKRFSLDFTNSVLEFGKKNSFITSHQYNSLIRVHSSFQMGKEEFSDVELEDALEIIRFF